MCDKTIYLADCISLGSVLPQGRFRLVYLDPPFLSGRLRVGSDPEMSYDDRWPGKLEEYLAWLQDRLQVLIPLLKSDGSLVLHLDWRAAHYAKVILDRLMGYDNFQNEIIWHYTGGGRSKRRFSTKHDTLLWYGRSTRPFFNPDAVRVPYKPTSGYAKSGIVSAAGKKYQPNPGGTPIDDVWDIPIINPLSSERVGYPTQKPLQLLTRLILALTEPDDLVLDPFCGSGTTLVAAQKLNRRWVGADISPAAAACAEKRLSELSTVKLLTHPT